MTKIQRQKHIDQLNYQRWEYKTKLQSKFFKEELSERKIGYSN